MAKSVTVKIGGDTKDFINSLRQADKQINTTQKTADNLSKSLKMEFSEKKFVQAQKQYTAALEKTEAKADALRTKLRELEEAGKVDSADYSALELELAKAEVKATDLRNSLKELNNVAVDKVLGNLEKVGNKAESTGKSLKGLSLGAGGVLAAMGAISKKSATLGAEIDDLSLQFGVSAETIQEWQYLAVQCGVSSDTLTKSFVKIRSAMADLSTGTANNATKALQELGINPNQFKTQEEMFDGIVAALSNVKDATLQTAYANEIFGDKIATEMLPYINTGTETIKKFKAEFAAMPSLSNEQVAALAELDDTYYRLSESVQYATAQVGVALAPVMERAVELIEKTLIPALTKLGKWFEGLSPTMQNIIVGGLGILALAAPTLIIIGKMSTGIAALIKLFKTFNAAQLRTAAGFAAIAGAAALGIDIISNWKNMSTVEKILKSLALAALVAAAAVTVFHSSWSLGIAIGAIAAGIVAGLAAINAAKDSLLPDTEDFTADNLEGLTAYNPDAYDYDIPRLSGSSGNSYADYSNNGSYNITINVTEPNATAEEIAAAVSKEIATLAQSRR
ncbi:MAG: hypothetical protein K2N23_04530 [Clostridia bacterium]|nr:hypothetical protein [Clostridia bacterium]